MNLTILSIVIDVLVLGFLGITTFYAIKLSESLNAFRKNKQEFEAIMRVLNRNIEDAYRSIDKLKDTAKESGQTLSKVVTDSRRIAVELETINQESAALATRLQTFMGTDTAPESYSHDEIGEDVFRQLEKELEAEEDDSFSIMDRDAQSASSGTPNFTSQAERDLYEALQRGRKASGRG